MKFIVIGGTGLIGSSVVTKLRESGFEAVAASPNSGVDTLTGEGLAEVLRGASVAGSPSDHRSTARSRWRGQSSFAWTSSSTDTSAHVTIHVQ